MTELKTPKEKNNMSLIQEELMWKIQSTNPRNPRYNQLGFFPTVQSIVTFFALQLLFAICEVRTQEVIAANTYCENKEGCIKNMYEYALKRKSFLEKILVLDKKQDGQI